MSNFPQQFDKGDKKLVAVSPKMREFFKKARLLTRKKFEISSLNYEDLREFQILLQEEIDGIAAQLNKAKADAVYGHYANPDWYRSAETAKKHMGRWMLEIQLQMHKAKEQGKIHKDNRNREYKENLTETDWDGFYKILRYLQRQSQLLKVQK